MSPSLAAPSRHPLLPSQPNPVSEMQTDASQNSPLQTRKHTHPHSLSHFPDLFSFTGHQYSSSKRRNQPPKWSPFHFPLLEQWVCVGVIMFCVLCLIYLFQERAIESQIKMEFGLFMVLVRFFPLLSRSFGHDFSFAHSNPYTFEQASGKGFAVHQGEGEGLDFSLS